MNKVFKYFPRIIYICSKSSGFKAIVTCFFKILIPCLLVCILGLFSNVWPKEFYFSSLFQQSAPECSVDVCGQLVSGSNFFRNINYCESWGKSRPEGSSGFIKLGDSNYFTTIGTGKPITKINTENANSTSNNSTDNNLYHKLLLCFMAFAVSFIIAGVLTIIGIYYFTQQLI